MLVSFDSSFRIKKSINQDIANIHFLYKNLAKYRRLFALCYHVRTYQQPRGEKSQMCKKISQVLCFTFVFSYFTIHAHAQSYEDCILKHIKGVNSRVAIMEIRRVCRSKYPSEWKYFGVVRFTSPVTKNNHDKWYQSQYCPHSSPDKKTCASEVSIYGSAPSDAQYEYRFQSIGVACPVTISSGPKGWMRVLHCSLSPNKKSFHARIIGWTWPQTFTAQLKVERRKK